MSSWKRDMVSGLVVLAPIIVVLLVLRWLYVRLAALPLTGGLSQPYGVLLAVAVLIVIIYSVGYLMRSGVGRLFERRLDAAMNHVPLIRILYNASKLAAETALTGTGDLQRPVRLEPWPGMRLTAFKTGQQTEDGREVIFMPTAPNITTGFVMEVHPDDFEELDESVEQALTRVLSAGFADESDSAPGRTLADRERPPRVPRSLRTKAEPESEPESEPRPESKSGTGPDAEPAPPTESGTESTAADDGRSGPPSDSDPNRTAEGSSTSTGDSDQEFGDGETPSGA